MSNAVLITGAGTRIGRVIAKGLAADGWAVAVHYNRSKEAANTLCRQIIDADGFAVAVGANLHIPAEVDTLISCAAKALGMPLTALINNASTFQPDKADTFSNALLDHHMDVNLRAPTRLAQEFAAQCPILDGGGVIINMLDQRVLKPNPLYFTYSMSKAALYWATKTLAQALAPTIRVNGVGPGPTLQGADQTAEEFAAECANTLLGTGPDPTDMLGAVRYLLGAGAVTGQMIAVDSGQHLTWETQDLLLGGAHGA